MNRGGFGGGGGGVHVINVRTKAYIHVWTENLYLLLQVCGDFPPYIHSLCTYPSIHPC